MGSCTSTLVGRIQPCKDDSYYQLTDTLRHLLLKLKNIGVLDIITNSEYSTICQVLNKQNYTSYERSVLNDLRSRYIEKNRIDLLNFRDMQSKITWVKTSVSK